MFSSKTTEISAGKPVRADFAIDQLKKDYLVFFHYHIANKLDQYIEEIEGRKPPKPGKKAQIVKLISEYVESAIGILNLVPNAEGTLAKSGAKSILNAVQSAFAIYGRRKHLAKANIILEQLNPWCEDFQEICFNAALEVCHLYQRQFLLKGYDTLRAAKHSLFILAMDAAMRAIDYMYKNSKEITSDNLMDVIVNGVLYGESKKDMPLTKRYPSRVKRFYGKAGIVRIDVTEFRYFFSRKGQKPYKFGYRLSTEMEAAGNGEKMIQLGFKLEDLEQYEYKRDRELILKHQQEHYVVQRLNNDSLVESLIKETKDPYTRIFEELQTVSETLIKIEGVHPYPRLLAMAKDVADIKDQFSRLLHPERVKVIHLPIWTAPPPVEDFTGRIEFLDRLHTSIQNSVGKGTVISQSKVIAAYGGIGKSEVAKQYAKLYREHYENNALWIKAQTMQNIEISFLAIADKFEINYYQKNIITVVKQVYDELIGHKYLLIFDDADGIENITDFFAPLLELSPDIEKPAIIITSSFSSKNQWPDMEVLKLETFTDDEADEYIRKKIKYYEITEEEVKSLAKRLNNYPLALAQATSYIITDEEIRIPEYLQFLDQQLTTVLVRKLTTLQQYKKTILLIWQTTHQKLHQLTEHHDHKAAAKLSLQLLCYLPYLASDDIAKYFFTSLSDDEEVINRAFGLLKSYCIIKITRQENDINFYGLHKLVQEIISLGQEDEGKLKDNVLATFNLFSELMKRPESATTDTVHVSAVLKFIRKLDLEKIDWVCEKAVIMCLNASKILLLPDNYYSSYLYHQEAAEIVVHSADKSKKAIATTWKDIGIACSKKKVGDPMDRLHSDRASERYMDRDIDETMRQLSRAEAINITHSRFEHIRDTRDNRKVLHETVGNFRL